MRRAPRLVVRSLYLALCLALVDLTLGCAGLVDSALRLYTLEWVFVNNSEDNNVRFNGADIGGGQYTTLVVAAHSTGATRVTSADYTGKSSTDVSVEVTGGGKNKTVTFPGVGIGEDATSIVTVVWNGTDIDLSVCDDQIRMPLRASFANAVGSCAAPPWRLEGTTGLTSKTWQDTRWNGTQDITWTGNGTVSINWPQTLTPGETVVLAATFSVSTTYPQGAIDYYPVTINAGLYAPGQNNATLAETSKVIGTPSAASPTVSGAVTVTATYTVPSNGPGGKLTFYVNAYTSLFGFCFCSDVPTATYSKVP